MKRMIDTSGWLMLAGVMSLIVLAACAPAAAPAGSQGSPLPAPAAGQPPSPLEGKLWVVQTLVNAEGETVPVLPETRVTVEFASGRYAGSTGCNQYFGTYELDGARLTMVNGGMTERACERPIMVQEQAYAAAQAEVVTYSVEGDQLMLAGEDGRVLLTYAEDRPLPLVGTHWQLMSYNNGKGGLVTSLATELITGDFAEDGNLTGFAGCNNYSATYHVDGDAISIGPAATTRIECSEPQDVMEHEAGYLAALEMAATFKIKGQELTMFNDEGTRVLVYRAAEEETGGAGALEGIVWQWTDLTESEPASQSVVPNPEQYIVAFLPGNAVHIEADCNSVNGSYELEGDRISITVGPSTMAFCGEESLDQQFLSLLAWVDSYAVDGERLILNLAEDAGVMGFRNGGSVEGLAAAAAGSGQRADASLVNVQSVSVEERDGEFIAVVQGELSDACPRAYFPEQTVQDDGISITLRAVKPADAMCAQVITPFTEEVEIETVGLAPGTYTVAVNGVAADKPIAVGGTESAAAPAEQPCAGLDLSKITLGAQGLQENWQAHCAPAEAYDESIPPGPRGLPEHVEITFDGVASAARQPGDPIIYIIPIEPYEAMWEENGNDAVTQAIEAIEFQTARLPAPPDASGYPALPFEAFGGVNDLAVQVGRASSPSLSLSKNGFRFVGRWAQDPTPVTNQGLRYTYQGFSNDGRYLVSFWYPVSTEALPDGMEQISDEAMATFSSDPVAAIAAEAERLNQLNPSSWNPDLATLDALIGSLTSDDIPATVLSNGVWHWIGKRKSSSGPVKAVAHPESYALMFNPDGSFSVLADCNSGSGSFSAEGGLMGSVSIQLGPMTMAECGAKSRSDELLKALQAAQDYQGRAGGVLLDLILPDGGGELVFSLEPGGGSAERASVTGSVTYRQRIALPPDAVVQVQIQDVSLADAPAQILGEEIITEPGQVPILYDVAYDPAEIIENHTYSMSARITDAAGKLLFISDTHTPVITNDHPTRDVEIVVVPVEG